MGKNLFSIAVAAALGAALAVSPAHANVGEIYGFGSRNASLAGAGAAWGFEGFAAYHNPAALPLTGSKRLTFSFGVLAMDHRFKSINDVVVENDYTSDKTTPRRGNVDTEYRNTLGSPFGASYLIAPEWHRLTAGVTAFLPLESTAYMDTGEAFIPEYVLYRSRTQRPQIDIGFGGELGNGFFLGAGVHLGFTLTSNASVFLQADGTKPSTMRFASSLKPKAGPYAGFLWAPGYHYDSPTDAPADQDVPFTFGAVVRGAVNSANEMVLKSGARVFGNIAALDFNFRAISSLFYDPFAVELGTSFKYTPVTRLVVQADFQKWSDFKAPALSIQAPTIESCTGAGCGIAISPSQNPVFKTRDIWIPRLGHELYLGDFTLRLGYAYRPSFMADLPTEAGNYLDPPRHQFNVGTGFRFKRFLSFDTPFNLDLHVSWDQLVTQTISKTPGNERGQGTGDLKIGAPGYEAGGKVIGGGLSLTLAF